MCINERFSRFYEHYLINTFFKTKRFCGNVEGGEERIRKVFIDPISTKKAKADALRDEFGTGGCGWSMFNVDWSSKGVRMCICYFRKYEFIYKWTEIVDMIEDRGVFLN